MELAELITSAVVAVVGLVGGWLPGTLDPPRARPLRKP